MDKCTLKTPLLIANSILNRAFSDGKSITHLKLQKLVYFVYKRFLQQNDEPLFDDFFEVWTHGPVLRAIYDVFKSRGSNLIKDYAYDGNSTIFIVNERHENFYDALEWVWEHYHDYDPFTLSDLTHRDGTAWQRSRDINELYITDDLIREEEWLY